MTPISESSTGVISVAIDVAKQVHEVLIEPPEGDRQQHAAIGAIPRNESALQTRQCPLTLCLLDDGPGRGEDAGKYVSTKICPLYQE